MIKKILLGEFLFCLLSRMRVSGHNLYKLINRVSRILSSSYSVLIFTSGLFYISSAKGETENEQRLTWHKEPVNLHPDAKVSNWTRFNGIHDDAKSEETKILKNWSKSGPQLIWELRKGEGYASPAIKENIVVLFHRLKGNEIIEARRSEDGMPIWSHLYPVEYKDRYGYLNGPRASPVIVGDLVYTLGVTAWLTCMELKTGVVVWKRDLASEFGIPQNFFGKGSNPLAVSKTLVINLGGSNDRSVIGLDLQNGKTKWIVEDSWGASYSSPRFCKLNGRLVCLVFAGGESRPPSGGLLVIDPENGEKLARVPWRSSNYESVNAVPPTPIGDNRVFLSECYEHGSGVIHFDESFSPHKLWQNPALNIHWMTPILRGSLLFGISGRHQRGAQLFCLGLNTGEVFWREPVTWSYEMNGRSVQLELFRGSILEVEGHILALSELGSLALMKMDHNGWEILATTQLFFAPGTWTLPALSHGLLYVMQNEIDRTTNKEPRLLCYDLRAM